MRLVFAAFVVALTLPAAASAATGETTVVNGWTLPVPQVVTFTGSTLEDKLDMLSNRLGNRIINDVSPLIIAQKAADAERSRAAHDRERMQAAMEECRSQLRKANRDGKFFVTLRCVRTLLMLDLSVLRKKESDIAARTDVSAETRDLTLAVTQQLTDAIVAVVNAIDTGVYDGVEDLEDMKLRLYEQYRVHDLRGDLLLRIDRHRNWMAYLVGRMRLLTTHDTMNFLEMRRGLDDAAVCLWNAQDVLDSTEMLPPEALIKTAGMIRMYERMLPTCIGKFRAVTSILVQERLPPKSSKETQN